MIAESMTCYDPFCLGVNTHIAIARQHMAMVETESNIREILINGVSLCKYKQLCRIQPTIETMSKT